jgi:hypothetical protein
MIFSFVDFCFLYFRCVSDGYCSLEQADLIQLHVEKKLRKHYKIDEITGKSLSKSLVNYDDNEDELNEDDNSEKNSLIINNDESNHTKNEDKSISIETINKTGTSKTDINVDISSSSMKSPSTPKSNLSPGEIKPISPSSLSEGSPISN